VENGFACLTLTQKRATTADMSTMLLTEIDAFLTETGMSEYRFGLLAAKNGRLVERLRAGTPKKGRPARIWPETEMQVRSFIIAERQRRRVAA
jgi:hypothetical protein